MNNTRPIDAQWIRKHRESAHPRLLWRPGDESLLRARAASDETVCAYWIYLIGQAEGMLKLPPLSRDMIGHRLLEVARTALKRSTTLAFAWRMTGDRRYLECLDQNLRSVCGFSDWNPPHFLDTAEMAMAVALGLDWAHSGLPEDTRRLAEAALVEKAVRPSFIQELVDRLPLASNWNQVCNAGLVAAVLACDTLEESLAPTVLNRMRDWLPTVLATYAPDGIYPEGASYWSYGTGFHVLLLSMLETAVGTDFGLADYPGFMESADVLHLLTAPSGEFFNFSDCGSRPDFNEQLLWFAMKTGNPRHLQEAAIRGLPGLGIDPRGSDLRHAAAGMLWLAHSVPHADAQPLPLSFHAKGEQPVVVFRSAFDDRDALYLGLKGGRAGNSHGNMDAGSFVLEVNGVRWSLDPGNEEDYQALEEALGRQGGDLWDVQPSSHRWSVLTKNNFGHSTLSLDGKLHQTEELADIVSFNDKTREATVDLSAVLGSPTHRATRTFRVISDRSIEILDRIRADTTGTVVCWQMMTTAEVEIAPDGALLRQDGQTLRLTTHEPSVATLTVVPLDPPPLPYDKQIANLKRIEIHVPLPDGMETPQVIRIRLTGT